MYPYLALVSKCEPSSNFAFYGLVDKLSRQAITHAFCRVWVWRWGDEFLPIRIGDQFQLLSCWVNFGMSSDCPACLESMSDSERDGGRCAWISPCGHKFVLSEPVAKRKWMVPFVPGESNYIFYPNYSVSGNSPGNTQCSTRSNRRSTSASNSFNYWSLRVRKKHSLCGGRDWPKGHFRTGICLGRQL